MERREERISVKGAAVALILTAGFVLLGGPVALGAHPWWGTKVGFSGIVIGLIGWALVRFTRVPVGAIRWLSASTFVAGVGVTWIGKAVFVRSYGDDVLAGRAWFFGWIVLLAGAYLLIATLWSAGRSARG